MEKSAADCKLSFFSYSKLLPVITGRWMVQNVTQCNDSLLSHTRVKKFVCSCTCVFKFSEKFYYTIFFAAIITLLTMSSQDLKVRA